MDRKDNIKNLAKTLRLPAFGAYDEHVKPGMSVEEALVELMAQECTQRSEASVKRRIRDSGLPNGKTFDTFKLAPSIPHLKQEHVDALATCQFVKDKMNICALGGSGTGKSHILTATCLEAIKLGYTVKFMRVSDMVTMLSEASNEKTLGAMMKALLKVNILALDELGYITLSLKKAQLLFDVIANRSEAGSSIFVTSNFEFSRWGEFTGNNSLITKAMTTALVGKLAGNAIVLNMNGEDYRVASKKIVEGG